MLSTLYPLALARGSRSIRPRGERWSLLETGWAMASDKRVHVTLECTSCKRRNYITNKNKNNNRERIELKKYCKWERSHTVHKETR